MALRQPETDISEVHTEKEQTDISGSNKAITIAQIMGARALAAIGLVSIIGGLQSWIDFPQGAYAEEPRDTIPSLVVTKKTPQPPSVLTAKFEPWKISDIDRQALEEFIGPQSDKEILLSDAFWKVGAETNRRTQIISDMRIRISEKSNETRNSPEFRKILSRLMAESGRLIQLRQETESLYSKTHKGFAEVMVAAKDYQDRSIDQELSGFNDIINKGK